MSDSSNKEGGTVAEMKHDEQANSKALYVNNRVMGQESNLSNNDVSTQDENKSKVNSKQELEKSLRLDLQNESNNNLSNVNYNIEKYFSANSNKDYENKEAKNRIECANLQQNSSMFILDESIISDFKNNINNENLSSISKYFKRGSANYNENIFYDKNFNPQNNRINVISEKVEDIKEINTEIKDMLDKVMEYKAKAYLSFKANKINEAMKDYANALKAIRITPKIENYLNISNINMTKIECLNNIALCCYIKKDYENCIDKLNDVLKLNKKNLNALSYKAKALMALDRNREALVYIKQALAIKHNKTLYKYLIELENKSRSFNTHGLKHDLIKGDENRNLEHGVGNTRKPSHRESTEEYKKIFDNSDHSSSCCQHEYFNNNDNSREFLNRTKINENTNTNDVSSGEEASIINANNFKSKKKMNLKEYEEMMMRSNINSNNNKKNSSHNICGSIFKFFYLTFKIFLEKIKKHKSILILLIISIIFFKRKRLMQNIRYYLGFFCRGKLSSPSD